MKKTDLFLLPALLITITSLFFTSCTEALLVDDSYVDNCAVAMSEASPGEDPYGNQYNRITLIDGVIVWFYPENNIQFSTILGRVHDGVTVCYEYGEGGKPWYAGDNGDLLNGGGPNRDGDLWTQWKTDSLAFEVEAMLAQYPKPSGKITSWEKR